MRPRVSTMEKAHQRDDDRNHHRDRNHHHPHQLQEHQQQPLIQTEAADNERHLHHHHHHPQRDDVMQSSPTSRLSSWRLSTPDPAPPPVPREGATPDPPAPESLALELYRDNNPDPPGPKSPPVPPVFRNGCEDVWRWSVTDKSQEVRVCGPRCGTVFFHPNWSNGTAGVRGTRPLNRGLHYWEIRVSSRLFGTSMMFGVATRRARLHADSFLNLLGEDSESWGLSHKGLAWHGGRSVAFCPPFAENVAVTVGVVYDGLHGTLAYYKDGESLGVAFTGLHTLHRDLYPAVCSTAAKTEMTLGVTRRAFLSLQDRCRASIVRRLVAVRSVPGVCRLPLPRLLCRYVGEEAREAGAVSSSLTFPH